MEVSRQLLGVPLGEEIDAGQLSGSQLVDPQLVGSSQMVGSQVLGVPPGVRVADSCLGREGEVDSLE